MDTQKTIDEVNHGLAAYDGGPFTTNQTAENYHRTDLRGELERRAVRIEVSVEDAPGQCQYSIQLFDEGTGESLGRGNGGPTLNDAASYYQWNGALLDLQSKTD